MPDQSASFIADKANALEERKAELTHRLEHTEEAPVYVHPNMGKRYSEAVTGLIAPLNDPEHRPESAGIVRALIKKIVLTPNEERTALIVDLHGDLAGILQMSANKEKGRSLAPRDRLELSKRKEIEQIETVVDPLGTSSQYGYVPNKDTMVAGVGFEPTTFRL